MDKELLRLVIGLAAGLFGTIAFLPQVIKLWHSKSSKDISLPSFILLSFGTAAWLIYGFLRLDFPLILTNLVIFVSVILILYIKVKYRND